MSNTFQWTDELALEFAKEYRFSSSRTSIEQFKASKEPKKEWEIACFFEQSSGTYWKLQEDGTYKHDKYLHQKGYSLQAFLDDRDTIHSVRRLSDGEVFSVGDRIQGHTTAIQRFEISPKWEGGIGMLCNETDGDSIWLATKMTIETWLTEDKVEVPIVEGNELFYVSGFDYKMSSFRFSNNVNVTGIKGKFPDFKYFSTREAAENYIVNNKPLLSVEDVKAALCYRVRTNTENCILEELTNLVKSKL